MNDTGNDEEIFPCFCNLSIATSSDQFDVIKCSRCNNKYHIFCIGYTTKVAIDQNSYVCLSCTNDSNDDTTMDYARLR